jgi:hypothetical protein
LDHAWHLLILKKSSSDSTINQILSGHQLADKFV